MSAIAKSLRAYERSRGKKLGADLTTGRKVLEEAGELVVEVVQSKALPTARAAYVKPRTPGLAHEIADVVLSAAVVARHFGLTVEDCIAEKIKYDEGRDR